MFFSRLSRRITLFLSVASFVVSVVALVSHKPVPWYALVFLAFPPVVLFTLLLSRERNIPLKGKRLLAKGKADQLIAAALAPRQYPPCVHLCLAHANAVSIAALVSRAVILSIEQLELMMVHEIVEMRPREEAFCINVVETHLEILRDIQSVLSNLASQGNLVAECFRQLRGGEAVITVIEEVDSTMDIDVIYPMDTFLQGVPADVDRYDEHSKYEGHVRQLVTDDIPRALSRALEQLLAAKEPANKIYEQMRNDWHDDVLEGWQDSLCRPVRVDPPEKTGMKIDSIQKLVNNWKKNVRKTLDPDKNKPPKSSVGG